MAVRDIVQAAAGLGGANLYVEDVFSTYLYDGNGSTQTITNEIDLAGEGGLVWIKTREVGNNHSLQDTERGTSVYLQTNNTNAQGTRTDLITSFNSDGFTLGVDASLGTTNFNGNGGYTSWTFRKAPKFFDVVTYTGNNEVAQYVNHSLGVVPGCIILKSASNTGPWFVWHRGLSSTSHALRLNTAAEESVDTNYEIGINATDTQIYIDTGSDINYSDTYVAYLFAHDAGGFGDSGEENIISCGSYTGNGSASGPEINLGYEPQWILWKNANRSDASWVIVDNMRGISTDGNDPVLITNSSGAEWAGSDYMSLTSTGFKITTTETNTNASGDTHIYIAIRRGPMKTPTDATTVFGVQNNSNEILKDFGFPVDWSIFSNNPTSGFDGYNQSRLTEGKYLLTNSTAAESGTVFRFQNNIGVYDPNYYTTAFRRAPGFFDVVCWKGDGDTGRDINHNLQVVPEMVIIKSRSDPYDWTVYTQETGFLYVTFLNLTNAKTSYSLFEDASATQLINLNQGAYTNGSNQNYIAYLFASCPGVSKVGSYTGTGTTAQNINCGFSNGARFVLIKAVNDTGDWHVFDTVRGITAGDDNRILLNRTDAETTDQYINPYSAGFSVPATPAAGGYSVNASGTEYIFLAIA